MFNWLKRKKSIYNNWDFGDIADFDMIENPDSRQFVNKDGTRVIYVSALHVSGGDTFLTDSFAGKPTIVKNADSWQLKGAKKSKNQILVCVISVSKQDDIEWANIFFDSIAPC